MITASSPMRIRLNRLMVVVLALSFFSGLSSYNQRASAAECASTTNIVGLNTVVLITTTGACSFTIPSGASSLKIEAWAGGGGSMGNDNSTGAGAGGAYASSTVNPSGAPTLFVSVGAGGIGGQSSGTAGGDSWANTTNNAPTSSTSGVLAKGGSGAPIASPNNSTQRAASIGTTIYIGGAGGTGAEGGGGAGASSFGNGGNGANGNGGAGGASPSAGAGGSAGGTSLNGGNGLSNVEGGGGGGGAYNYKGGMGGLPGGAGGSGYSTSSVNPSSGTNTNARGYGGDGGRGQIRITYANGISLTSSGGLTVTGTAGVIFFDTITASGGTTPRTISMDSPKTGVIFDTNTGIVSINAPIAATFTQIFTATDSSSPGKTNSITVTFVVNAAPTVSPKSSTITTTLGRTASETITVTNGTGSKTFALTSSVFQAGITLDITGAATGFSVLRVAATGVVPGTYIETVTATDSVGAQVVSVVTVRVNPAPTLRGETTTALVTTIGKATLETITAENGTGAKTFTLTQGVSQSAGITLDTTTATLGFVRLRVSETVAAGTYYETITATDSQGSVVTYAKTVLVNSALSFSLGASSTFGVSSGISGYDTLTVTGGTGPRTVTVVGVPNNSGVTVSAPTSSQVVLNISSTVPAATYLETITVTDSVGASATHLVTLTVSGPIRFDASNITTINTSAGTAATSVIRTASGNTGKVFTMTPVSTPVSNAITLDTSTAALGYVTIRVAANTPIGSYLESITVVDASNSRAVTVITVNVNAAPVLTFESSTAGSNFSSLNFNGTNQYVTVPANANWQQLGSSYTIEWWQFQTDSNAYTRIFSFGSNGLAVSIEGGTFYFWNNGARVMNTAGTLSVKNKWVHFAIVSRNNSVTVYLDGVALKAAQTLSAVSATQIPTSYQLCIGSQCNTTGYSMFGGRIANFTISKIDRYAGTNLSSANFVAPKFGTVDANTIMALSANNSEAKFTDASSFSRVVTNINSPTGNSAHPSASSSSVSMTTTQGLSKRSSVFSASAGTGTKTFTLTPTVGGITLDTSLANSAYLLISDTVTATNSTTARIINESVTATDSLGTSTSFNVAITVNPPILLTATSTNFSSTAGLMGYDTITATTNTGTGAITFSLVSNPISSGITLVTGTNRNTVLTIARTVTSGTYYETITATDSLGATTSIPITVTVNPGISLAGAGGVTTLSTSTGRAASLQINALNGGSGKTFTMQAASVATSAGITLDTTNAALGYAVVRVATSVPANTYLETITVTDSQGGTARLLVTVIVNPAPTLTGPSTIQMTAGKAATTSAFTAASGTGTRTLSISGSNLGITVDTSTANSAVLTLASSLTSTNTTTPRTITETVTVTDSSGATATKTLTITVNPSVIETATATSISTSSGILRTVTIYASQGTGSKTFTRSSAVASSAITMTNLVTNQAVLTISGLASPGTYYETVTATDTLGAQTSLLITVVVNPPPTISGSANIFTTQGVSYTSPNFQAANGNGTYTFTLLSNPVAAGITVLNPLSGVARIQVASTVTAGTYYETLTVTDGVSATGFITFTIKVNAPVALTGTQTVNTIYGTAFTTGYNTSGGTGPFQFSTSDICTVSRSTFVGDGSNGTVNGTSYTVDQIRGSGSCNWVVPNGVTNVSTVLVGGGGGGAGGGNVYTGSGGGGGGGGAGAVVTDSRNVTAGSTVAVVIGVGGSSGGAGNTATWNGISAGNGAATTIFGVTAAAGGGGYGAGLDASSGQCTAGRAWTDGSGGYGGNSGIYSGGAKTCAVPGGGGGGASSTTAGAQHSGATGGAGGTGVTSFITGSSTVFGAGGRGGDASVGGGDGAIGATPGSGGSGGNGRNNATAGVGGKGATGLVAIRYVTPTADPSESQITFTAASAGSSGSAGLINLSVPSQVPAGTYTKSVFATDSTGVSSSSVTINIVVAKANPLLSLSLPGAVTTTQYGFGVVLSAQASTAGSVEFKDNGSTISGCSSKSTASFIATCRWIPSAVATRTLTATFTPTDTSNFNVGIVSTLSVVVVKADTLTVTSSSEYFTYTGSPVSALKRFTYTGLAEIDSVTSVTTTFVGTANDSTAWSSTTTPTKAGSNYEMFPSALTFSAGAASNYLAINYVSGTLSIARATSNATFNYSGSNNLTYSPAGIDTPTVTSFGEAIKTFTGASPEKCSINSSSGALSILQAGICSVTLDVVEGFNYLATSVTKNVVIAKAARTLALSTAGFTLKYGDTATVTSTISAGASDGVFSYALSNPSICQYDDVAGELTGISGSGNCVLTASIAEGTNYLLANSNTLTLTAAKADAPVVTTNAIDPVSYANGSAITVTPAITVSGLKFADAASGATFTYNFVSSPAGVFTYSSTTVPTEGGTYSVTASNLSLSSGTLLNYQAPIYQSSQLVVEQIDQPALTISDLVGELLFPLILRTVGGAASAPAPTFTVTTSTATECRALYGPVAGSQGASVWSLQAESAGSCSIIANRGQTRNFREVTTDTATVTVLEFVKPIPVFVNNFTSGVTLSSSVTLSKGPDACTSECVPSISSLSAYTGYIGDLLVITGQNFTGATKVIFSVFTEASNFSNDPITPDSVITVQVPAGLTPGEIGIEIMTPNGITPRNFDFELLP